MGREKANQGLLMNYTMLGDWASPGEILVNCVENALDWFHRRMETWEKLTMVFHLWLKAVPRNTNTLGLGNLWPAHLHL